MRIIEKIEIKNFRSFLGTRKDDKAEIMEIADLNIFSGSNDSGKSNILRALNLFFNDEIDNVHKFNFENDFNISKKELTQKVIEIKVHFLVDKRKFSISKFYGRNGYRNFEYRFRGNREEIVIDSRSEKNKERYKRNPEIANKENGYRRYAIRFISSISFSYVPAIREERFFSHLYGKIIFKIKKNEEKNIEQLQIEQRKIERWQRTLKNKSEKTEFLSNLKNSSWRNNRIDEINNEIKEISSLKKAINSLEENINNFSSKLFKSVDFLSSEFKIGTNLIDFFESFDIGTGNEKNLSLRLRGDGIQAKFIPEMLSFMDLISTDKRFFIWGFEEPENSAEYKNQQLLAEKLKNQFSEKKQIFITTHSEEFLSIYDGDEIEKDKRRANLYHVKKINNDSFNDFSVIELFDVESNTFKCMSVKSELEQDLGSSLIRAKYSKELKEKEDSFLKEKTELESLNKPVLFVEGELEEKILKKILNNQSEFQIKAAGCSDTLGKYIIGKSFLKTGYKVYGLFDKDSAGKAAVQNISNKRSENTKVKNGYIIPNERLKQIIQKQGIEFSFDELLPDFVWEYLYDNDYLEDGEKFDKQIIPPNKSCDEFLKEKFLEDKIAILKVTQKIKRVKKQDLESYILELKDDNFKEIANALKETLAVISEYFAPEGIKIETSKTLQPPPTTPQALSLDNKG